MGRALFLGITARVSLTWSGPHGSRICARRFALDPCWRTLPANRSCLRGGGGVLRRAPKSGCCQHGLCLSSSRRPYSGKDPEESVQEERPLASDEPCSLRSWLAALPELGHHVPFPVK